MVVNTTDWLPGRDVLISPEWIERVDWADASVAVDLEREAIKQSPKYDRSVPIDRHYEVSLYDHYGRPIYW
jgi:hypothetical protein